MVVTVGLEQVGRGSLRSSDAMIDLEQITNSFRRMYAHFQILSHDIR